MKKILLLLLSLYVFASASSMIDGPTGTNATNGEDPLINTNIESTKQVLDEAKKQIAKDTQNVLDGKVEEYLTYFDYVESSSCESYEQLKCPPLTDKYKDTHSVMINYINPMAGEVSCSVYPNDGGKIWSSWSKDQEMTPIYTKVFRKKACVEKFSDAENIDNSKETNDLRDIVEKREKEFNELKLTYDIDFKQSGGEKYLDLGDWLDALATMDSEKIDIQKTLLQGEVSTTQGYTTVPNIAVVDKFQEAIKDLMGETKDVTEAQRQFTAERYIEYRDKNKKIANAQYVMYLDFFTKANKYINETVNMLLVIFLMYNIFGNWGLHFFTTKLAGGSGQENHWHRGIMGIGILLMFFVGTVDKINIQNSDGTQTEIEVKSQRIQDFVRIVYAFTNKLSDNLAELAIDSYLKSLTMTSGIANIKQINSLTSEKLELLSENKMLYEVSTQMCKKTYDETNMKINMKKYRDTKISERPFTAQAEIAKFDGDKAIESATRLSPFVTAEEIWNGKNTVYGDFLDEGTETFGIGSETINKMFSGGTLDINVYPYSEREAHASLYETQKNPYSDSGGYVNSGYFKSDDFLKSNQWIGLSGCFNINKQMVMNAQRYSEIDKKIMYISEEQNNRAKQERIKNIHNIMRKDNAELGYVSIIFLPALATMVDENGNMRQTGLEPIKDEESLLEAGFRAAPLIAMFGGNQIAQFFKTLLPEAGSKKSKKANAKKMAKVGKGIPIIGDIFGMFYNGTLNIVSYAMAYYIIVLLLQAVTLIVVIGAGIIAFVLITLMKMWAFFALIFVVVYAFHKDQEQKMLSVIGKVITTSFKPVLFVVSMFIAVWSLGLVNGLEQLLISDFFNNMKSLEGEISFSQEGIQNLLGNLTTYTFYGVTNVIFVIVKIILSITIILKLPNYFFELLDVHSQDIADQIHETIEDVNRREAMKGI